MKVCENSAADKGGLRVGDVIMRINNVDESNQHMLHELNNSLTKCIIVQVNRQHKDNLEDTLDAIETTTEECIAEIISGEAELLENHNIIG